MMHRSDSAVSVIARKQETEELQIELAVYQALAKIEQEVPAKKTIAEMKNKLAQVKTGLATFREELKSGAAAYWRKPMLMARFMDQYSAQMLVAYDKREAEQMKPPGRSTTPGRLRPGQVAALPDRCLLMLFSQMKLIDQLEARKVCQRWAALMLQVTSLRRSLTLLTGVCPMTFLIRNQWEPKQPVALPSYIMCLLQKEDGSLLFPLGPQITKWNSVSAVALNGDIVEQIASTFTGVTQLQVAVWDANASFCFLADLLGKYSHQVVAFKLVERSCDAVTSADASKLFSTINGLYALKHLALDLECLELNDLAIIARLEMLDFFDDPVENSSRNTHPFLEMVQQHGQANQSLAIRYQSRLADPGLLNHFTSLSEHLRGRFLHLYASPWMPFASTELLCDRFRSLLTLTLELPSFPNPITWQGHLFGHLAKLNQLIYLRLVCESPHLASSEQLPQVKSLKALELDLKLASHDDLEQISLALPNLQVLNLGICPESRCTACQVMIFKAARCFDCGLRRFKDYDSADGPKKCLRQLFGKLKRNCGKLHTILYNYEDVYGPAEELLEQEQSAAQ